MVHLGEYVLILKLYFTSVQAESACCYDQDIVKQKFQANETLFQYYLANAKWPTNIIYYDVDPHMDRLVLHFVALAIDYFNDNLFTCVRWRQRFPDGTEDPGKHWVSFVQTRDNDSDPTLYSNIGWNLDGYKNTHVYIGRHYAGRFLDDIGVENLILAADEHGLEFLTNLMHEMMHVMGFQHEHQRGDRDCWIYVSDHLIKHYPENHKIFDNWQSLFSPKFPYDSNSILHYTANGPHLHGHTQALRAGAIGRTDGSLSVLDLDKLNYVYCGFPTYCDITRQCEDDLDEYRYLATCYREGDDYNTRPTCTPCQRPRPTI